MKVEVLAGAGVRVSVLEAVRGARDHEAAVTGRQVLDPGEKSGRAVRDRDAEVIT